MEILVLPYMDIEEPKSCDECPFNDGRPGETGYQGYFKSNCAFFCICY